MIGKRAGAGRETNANVMDSTEKDSKLGTCERKRNTRCRCQDNKLESVRNQGIIFVYRRRFSESDRTKIGKLCGNNRMFGQFLANHWLGGQKKRKKQRMSTKVTMLGESEEEGEH